jgi:hypothetical protein
MDADARRGAGGVREAAGRPGGRAGGPEAAGGDGRLRPGRGVDPDAATGAAAGTTATPNGSRGRRSCPAPNTETRTDTPRWRKTRFRKVITLPQAGTRATAAAVSRRITLKLRLVPGLYRITVRAQLDDNRLSHPLRGYMRVLS